MLIGQRTEIIETMAREGQTDEEWEQETFAYIKVQRQRAARMLEALEAAGYSIEKITPDAGWSWRA